MTKEKTDRPVLEAIRKARPHMKLKKSGHNKHRNYYYPTLQDYYDAVLEPLEKVGCTLTHKRFIMHNSSLIALNTMITHTASGDYINDECLIESESPGNQGRGAATTYMMKDAIRCLLGLPAEDDDAQSEQDDIKKSNGKKASNFQVSELRQLIDQTSNPQKMLGQILHYNKVGALEELGEQQCNRAAYRVKEIIDSR